MEIPPEWTTEPFCYVTSVGRRTGRPHRIEIWFGLMDGSLYMLAGGRERADWVRNMRADPNVTVSVRDVTFEARARFVEDPAEDARARELLAAKYQGWEPGAPLTEWARTALPVALTPIE